MATPQSLPPEKIADRYVVRATLGRGGMGTVYRVYDETEQREVALKRLQRAVAEVNTEAAMLFRREYYTLRQLQHPNIIEVYDCGIDDSRVFYTMELIEGHDLREMAPVPWRRASELLRDVALALSLLHSRRLLHRDLSPRNVRCTEEGGPKLIDFGTMATVGVPGEPLGTAPFVSPEAVHGRPLDARSDLYSLGGLAYWLLTGKHAYATKRIRDLKDLWRSAVRPPSTYARDIPSGLDSLVLSLLSLDVRARPASAAEVIDRLTALAGLPATGDRETAQAHLATPAMAGRDGEIVRMSKALVRAVRYRGGAIHIQGDGGIGRSRLLSELVMQAKLAGAIVLETRASGSDTAPYSVARKLVQKLFDTAPTHAMMCLGPAQAILAGTIEGLQGWIDYEADPDLDAAERRRAEQTALRDWLLLVSKRRTLVLSVDDLQDCDEPSAALLAALAREAPSHKLIVATTLRSGAAIRAPNPVRALRERAVTMQLDGLSLESTETLLRSVFGDAANLKGVARWVHRLSRGNPLQCMELGRHLVDAGMARYDNGSWRLPRDVAEGAMPADLAEMFDRRVAGLSEAARALADVLCLHGGELGLGDLLALGDSDDETEVFLALDELVAADILWSADGRYAFVQQGLSEAVSRAMSDDRRRRIHLRIGERMLDGDLSDLKDRYRAAHHLLQGDAEKSGTRVLVDAAGAEPGPRPLLELAGFEWTQQALKRAIRVCEREGWAPCELFFLRFALLNVAGITHKDNLARDAEPLIEQLQHDVGLDEAERLRDEVPDMRARVVEGMKRARQRYEECDPAERGLPPTEAAYYLVSSAISMLAHATGRHDQARVAWLTDIVEPIAQVHSTAAVIWETMRATTDRVHGRLTLAAERRQDALTMLDDRDLFGGLADGMQAGLMAYQLHREGIYQAMRNPVRAERLARAILEVSSLEALAWQVRLVASVCDGDMLGIEQSRDRLELATLLAGEVEQYSGIDVAMAYAQLGDLMELKRMLDSVGAWIDERPGWLPFFQALQATYHRLRGELVRARQYADQALQGVSPGEHGAWPCAITEQLRVLLAEGSWEQAQALAQQALQDARQARSGTDVERSIEVVLGMAEAKLGEHAEASARLQRVVEEAERDGFDGVPLAQLHEQQAKVALVVGDELTFRRAVEHVVREYRRGEHPVLIRRREQLLEAAKRGNVTYAAPDSKLDLITEGLSEPGRRAAELQASISAGPTAEQRALVALRRLTELSGTAGGYLYGMQADGLRLAARLDVQAPADELDKMLREFISAELEETTEVTVTGDDNEGGAVWSSPQGDVYYAIPLLCRVEGAPVMVGVAALSVAERAPQMPRYADLEAMAQALLEAGDVVSAFAAV